jgi:hypothetical protein
MLVRIFKHERERERERERETDRPGWRGRRAVTLRLLLGSYEKFSPMKFSRHCPFVITTEILSGENKVVESEQFFSCSAEAADPPYSYFVQLPPIFEHTN